MSGNGPPRVLHLITTLDRGGAEHALLHLVRALHEAGSARCDVSFWKGAGELAGEFAEAGAGVTDLGRGGGPVGAAGHARRLVGEARPDVVHTHLFKADCLGAALCRGRGRPALVSTKHNQDVYLSGAGTRRGVLRAVARRVALRADALVAITPGVQRFFAETLGAVADDMREIPYGLGPAPRGDAAAFRAAHRIGPDAVVVLCAARFAKQKDHGTLLQAFRGVRGDVVLVLAGRGPLESDVRAAAAGDERVRVVGFLRDTSDAFAAADAVVLSSVHEGLGLVLLEAARRGLPAVATRVGGVPDVVADGDTGLLVPPRDPPALAAAMQRVCDDRALRARIGEAARARAAAHHDPARCAEAHARLYRDVVRGRTR